MINRAVTQITPGWFRMLLATSVVLYHTSRVVFFGYWAVFVFFMLSGYWLTEMYRGKYQKAKNESLVFLVSRVMRIMPVFLVSSAIGLAVARCGFGGLVSEHAYETSWIVRTLIPLGNSALYPRLIETAWSLDIEVQFYILFPLIFAAVISRNRFAIASTISILIALTWFFGFQHSLLVYSGFFLIGMFISQTHWQASPLIQHASLMVLFLLIFGVFVYPESRASLLAGQGVMIADQDVSRLLDVVMAIVVTPFVSVNVRVKETPLGYHAGNLSYPIYLIHWVLLAPYVTWYGGLPGRERLPYFAGYLVVSFVVSLFIYVIIDRPSDRLRRKFVGRYIDQKRAIDRSIEPT